MKIQICFLQQTNQINVSVKFYILSWNLHYSALLEWFLQHERGGPISGELLREKARKLYALMYPSHMVPQLKFSNGWLNGFKGKHGIKEHTRHGESGSADMNAIEQQRS